MAGVAERQRLLAFAALFVSSTLSITEAQASPLSGSLSIGAEFDSNVSVDEAEINARQGDLAALLSAKVDLKAFDSQSITLNLGYAYDRTQRHEIKSYNLDIHQAAVGLSVRRGKTTFNVDHKVAHVRLGGTNFLKLNYLSPSVTGFISDRAYARLGYSYITKAYRTSDQLDAQTHTVSFDLYGLFNRKKGYVSVGLRQDHENAVGPEYDYRAWQVTVRAMVPVKVAGTSMKLRPSYVYAERTYNSETVSIAERREEKRSTYGMALDAPLSRRLIFKPTFRYVDRTSNVPLFDYREHTVAGVLQFII